jgi:hypothetical protein
MAITAHYCLEADIGGKKKLTLRSHLIAFRHLEGSHTGQNIAKVFLGVLKEFNIAHKVRFKVSSEL